MRRLLAITAAVSAAALALAALEARALWRDFRRL